MRAGDVDAATDVPGAAGRLAEDVYWRLRRDITSGVLRPNEPLVEAEVAARLGVSRTPVRESMQRLAADGLIVSRRRRWLVYEHTPPEVVELYEIRAALEGYAARLASLRATDEQRAVIRGYLDQMTGGDGARRHRVELNEKFHDAITAAANNGRIAELTTRNRLFHFNYRAAALYTAEDLRVSSQQHRELAEAVCGGDPDRAERILREHIDHALRLLLDRFF